MLEWAAASRSQAWASAADEEMAQRIYSDENTLVASSGSSGSRSSGGHKGGGASGGSGNGRNDFKSPFPLLPPMAPGMAGSYDGGSSRYDRMKYSTQPLRARPPVQSFARGYLGNGGCNNSGNSGGVLVVGSGGGGGGGALRGSRSISLPAVCEAEDDEEDGDGADDDGWARAAEGGGIVATGGVGAGVPGTALRLLRLLLAHGASASASLKLSDEDVEAAFAEAAAAGGGGGDGGDGARSNGGADIGKEESKGGGGVSSSVSTSNRKGHQRSTGRNKAKIQGDTPLHVACRYGLVGAAKDLALVSNLFARSGHEHATPLHLACAQGQVDVISVLLAAADTVATAAAAAEAATANAVATAAAETVAATTAAAGAALLAAAPTEVVGGAAAAAASTLESGAGAIIAPTSTASASPVSAARRALCALRTNLPFGETPLHWCARRGHAAALQALVVTGGAALNAPRALDGATPLGVAMLCQERSAADALVALGASLEHSPVQWPSPHSSSVLPLTTSASSPLPLGAPSEPPLPSSSSSPLPLSVARLQPPKPPPQQQSTTTTITTVKDAQEEGWQPYGRAQGTGARSPGSPPGSPPMLPTSSKLKHSQDGNVNSMGGGESLDGLSQPNFNFMVDDNAASATNGSNTAGGAGSNEFQPIEAGATLADYDRRSGDM